MRSLNRFAAVLIILLGLVPTHVEPALNKRASVDVAKQERKRLVLLIVVDQFRYDYLTRFGDLFESKGIGRLMREGASWTHANYDQVPTYTAPGHASLMTGSWPRQNGIVANDWFERETGKKVTSVTDETTKLLEGLPNATGYSPRRLLCSTVGDELRQATNNRSKVIGISAKGRSAILPSGRRASAAYWYSMDNGNMVSSTYYFNRVPDWVEQFNRRHMVDEWFGARWDRLLPEREYFKRAGQDEVPWENLDKASRDSNSFPHFVTGVAASPDKSFYRAIDYSPFSNDLLLAFAQTAITNEKLGADDETDVLTISFSANDHVGHRFGPNSQEVMDMALRVDRQIGALLDFVDAQVGLRNTVVIFSADHGVAPVPEYRRARKLSGRRTPEADFRKVVEDGLKKRYGARAGDYIQTFGTRKEPGVINANIYLNYAALTRDGVDQAEVEQVVGKLAMRVPGVKTYFTRTQLENNDISLSNPIARRVRNGFYPARSGDVIVVLEPYEFLFEIPSDPADTLWTATHGSAFGYDTHVPLIIMGQEFVAGKYKKPATPADIAPTVARVLGMSPPSCSSGRVLSEAFATSQQKR
ncbi:MAG TPA: alkaline phosphatase family protein [Pyrinomonadaceae bacterium]|nr:alkaline phosphatase family protein [Pyrinomonadaceae bacterium]